MVSVARERTSGATSRTCTSYNAQSNIYAPGFRASGPCAKKLLYGVIFECMGAGHAACGFLVEARSLVVAYLLSTTDEEKGVANETPTVTIFISYSARSGAYPGISACSDNDGGTAALRGLGKRSIREQEWRRTKARGNPPTPRSGSSIKRATQSPTRRSPPKSRPRFSRSGLKAGQINVDTHNGV